jgi:RNA polymerase sigma-70 factor (ECF subfamily)
VHRHFDQIHGLAFKMTSSRVKADDIAQDVFLKVVKSLHRFEGKSQFSTWLYRIAMNTIYTSLKKQNTTVANFGESIDLVPDKSERPDQVAMQSEMSQQIEGHIQKLKPDFRAAIVLTAFQNFSPGEAARIAGCTPTTFYWRLNQARTQLKKELHRYLKSSNE